MDKRAMMRPALAAMFALAASACSNGGTFPAAGTATAHRLPAAQKAKGALLYVSDYLRNDIVVFPASERAGNAQGPSLFAVTRNGELYAPQQFDAQGSVAEFARNGSTPINTLSGAYLAEPEGAALESETP